ncbi:disease resistance family protein / LRR family protein, partial [Prunus dulcis]
GDGRCLKLFLALLIVFLQNIKGGEVGHSHSHSHNFRDATVTVRCIERERQALLAFKRGLVDDNEVDQFNQLSTWGSETEKQDCCRWEGVYCSNQTGHVIQLDIFGAFTIFDLTLIDFNESQIPDFLGSLTNLKHLTLHECNLVGQIPSSFGNLTQLQHLDLSYNQLQPENLNWLPAPSSLTYLDLSGANLSTILDLSLTNFNGSQFPDFIGSLTNLRNLRLSSCNLVGRILSSFGNLKELQNLDLSDNQLQPENLNWLPALSSLTDLYLSGNFNGSQIPDFIGSLTNLSSFGNLTQLQNLDLSNNQLQPENLNWLPALSSLTDLDLSRNNLSLPPPPTPILSTTLYKTNSSTSLAYYKPCSSYLSNNNLSGFIPDFTANMSSLAGLDLSNNNLTGFIPDFIGNMSSLADLDLSNNSLTGFIPDFIGNMSSLVHLDLSDNQIEGANPNSFARLCNLQTLWLQTNHLSGQLSKFVQLLPRCAQNSLKDLQLSENVLAGSLSFLCASADMSLTILNLSSNSFSGELPDCWSHLETLFMLDLSYNAFSGKIPMTIGSLFRMQTLKLRRNRFVGELPSSLKNCASLEVIDLGDNKLSGPIPAWLGVSFKNLVILMLSTNHFNGSMPSQLCHLTHIQIMDFSVNNISGSIPKCLNNLTTLAQKGNPSLSSTRIYGGSEANGSIAPTNYDNDASFIWKGRMQTYKSTLGLVKRIDLSSNRLTGEIPSEIMHLVGLISLNLSRNQLMGQITPEIGNLESLDSLDLSRNRIDGRIPTSLARIYRLSFLDLSYNNLSGKIPTGTQLQSFDPLDYAENPQLCGPPLKKMCANQNEPTDLSNEEDKDEFITLGFYINSFEQAATEASINLIDKLTTRNKQIHADPIITWAIIIIHEGDCPRG